MEKNHDIILSISELKGLKLYIGYIVTILLAIIIIYFTYGIFISKTNQSCLRVEIFIGYGIFYYILYMSYFRKSNRLIEIKQDRIIFDNVVISKENIRHINIKITEYWGMIERKFLAYFIYNGSRNKIIITDINDQVFETEFYISSYKMKSQLVDRFRYLKREYRIELKVYHKNEVIEQY
jgi:hypothetical protein